MWFQQEKLCQKHISLRYGDKERSELYSGKRISPTKEGEMETESPGNGCQAFRELGRLGCEPAQGGTGCAPLHNKDTYFSGLYGWHEISSAHMTCTHTRTPAYTRCTSKLVRRTFPCVQAKAVFAEHLRDKASELMQTYCHNPVFPPF